MSDGGTAAGWLATETGKQPFRWSITTGLMPLANAPGHTECQGNGLNRHNVVVGSCGTFEPYAIEAVLFKANGTAVFLNDLPSVPSGWHLDYATTINSQGAIGGGGHKNGVWYGYLLQPRAKAKPPAKRR
jgi:hypothetical protein